MNRAPQRSFHLGEHLRVLAGALGVGVVVVSAERELEWLNEQAASLLGDASPEAIAEHWPAYRDLFGQAIGRLAEAEGPRALDVERPGGEESRPLRLEAYPVREESGDGHLVIVRDREQVAALETDLQLAARQRSMARIYRALGHDLKAPLNALTINLDLLKTTLAKNPPADPVQLDRQQRYLKVLSDEMARLNRSLVSFIAQTVPQAEAEQDFDLRDLILDLVSLIAPQGKQQQVAVEVQLAEQTMIVEGLRDRLKQALLNLAVNALEAMPGGGRLHLKLESRMGQAAIVLQDTGPGIPPEVAERIWEMHFTTKATGTGVGLYVSRSIVEAMGGSIRVDSRPGYGTTFTVTIPIASKEA